MANTRSGLTNERSIPQNRVHEKTVIIVAIDSNALVHTPAVMHQAIVKSPNEKIHLCNVALHIIWQHSNATHRFVMGIIIKAVDIPCFLLNTRTPGVVLGSTWFV